MYSSYGLSLQIPWFNEVNTRPHCRIQIVQSTVIIYVCSSTTLQLQEITPQTSSMLAQSLKQIYFGQRFYQEPYAASLEYELEVEIIPRVVKFHIATLLVTKTYFECLL